MFYYNNPVYYPGQNGKAVLFMHGLTSGAAQGIPRMQGILTITDTGSPA